MEEEQQFTGEEFKDLVDVFKVLRRWRDENNQTFLEEETMNAETQEELSCD